MNTTIYLIRHSTRLSTQRIDEYNNNDSTTLKREKRYKYLSSTH